VSGHSVKVSSNPYGPFPFAFGGLGVITIATAFVSD
jgi:hypothetical protein